MSARLAQAATQQSPQCEPVPPHSDGAGLASSSRPNHNVQEAAQATPTERGHGLRSQPGHTRLGRCPIGRGPQSTFQRQRPVHRVNVEKLLSKNVLQLGLQKTTFSVWEKPQANNKTADTLLCTRRTVSAQRNSEQPDAPGRPGSDTCGTFALSESSQPRISEWAGC